MTETLKRSAVRKKLRPVDGESYYYEVKHSSIDLALNPVDGATQGHCLVPHTLSLVASDDWEDSSREGVVGQLDYYSLSNDGWSSQEYFDALDSIDSDAADFLSVLQDEDGVVNPFPQLIVDQLEDVNYMGPVALLQTLTIDPAWRGRGLGAALLAHALRYRMRGHSHAILKAYPLQFGSERPEAPADTPSWLEAAGYAGLKGTKKQATTKLRSFYSKLGFKQLDVPDDGCWMALTFAHDHDRAWMRALNKVK